MIELKTLVSCGRDPARSLPLRRGFLLIPLVLACFALSPMAQAAPAVLPTPVPGTNPDGCYPAFNTAEGCNALHVVTGGIGDTGVGWYSLFLDTTGSFNTGLGAGTLVLNNADSNTATGAAALLLNTTGAGLRTGTENCAYGTDALVFNTGGASDDSGSYNDAFGAFALFNNIDGFGNNAFGNHALYANITGAANTAVGDLALENNGPSGDPMLSNSNTAVGALALFANTDGDSNNAVGAAFLFGALGSNTVGVQNNAMGVDALGGNIDGSSNVGIGDSAYADNADGSFNTVVGWDAGAGVEGNDNIYIGATSGLPGGGAEDGHIRIGDPTPGVISACFIAGITGVPVTGDTVVVDANGQLGVAAPGSPLSANELLKQHQIVQKLKATAEKQQAIIALQESQIKALTASLREQATQIQKVSAQLEMIKPAPQVVENR
jgi:hypothetical protein